MKTLPNKLHELLQLAINDAQAIQRDPRYRLDMSVWHWSFTDQACQVCMAGAVMAHTLQVDVAADAYPGCDMFDDDTSEKLKTINLLRRGMLPLKYTKKWSVPAKICEACCSVKEVPWYNDWKAHKDFVAWLKAQDL